MPKFTADKQEERPIHGECAIDEDGAISWLLNGHRVGYISHRDGRLRLFVTSTETQSDLPGICFDRENRIHVMRG